MCFREDGVRSKRTFKRSEGSQSVICHLPFAIRQFAFCICHLGAGEKVNKGSEGEQKSTCEGNLLKVMYHVVHSMGEKGRINKYNTGGEESKTK